MRTLREARGLSLAALAQRLPLDKGHLSRIENGRRKPTEDLARRIDEALDARGELIACAHLDVAAALDARPWETAELLRRMRSGDGAPVTVETLQATVTELCCEYGWRDARQLRAEGQGWLREVARLLHQPVGLRQHRELLVCAGWLALLIGCVEYDLGMRAGAEATRTAARQLAEEAGHAELAGWAWEMAAWFALTQSRHPAVVTAARAGQEVAGSGPVAVQLIAQEAKALGRLGDVRGVRAALDRGRRLLDALPPPDRPDNHFEVDPGKWLFYAMDAYRFAEEDALAEHYAEEVIREGTAPDGTERSPMRTAEARLTVAATAARAGDLERAASNGLAAFAGSRRSLPSLLLVAGEVDAELHRRYPHERATAEFREALRVIR
ncbi:helix-turn-helix transcriptional regulator [Plantactinospora sp. KLBMP9567]|uniref:helix-turn-helix transcriptional regulator n=1 Tax=Plantactinospora sp. KLBMP9567 TaxID=3085900 RepID=UPI00298145BC|nr:helix-turn-helix transcriptional regulator [Plantactinospora sp. KLBMP9567]MDW5325591.1 helix-turn-helix transcriptional regulator [Plantactinospora sp. KLBMP9567]